MSAVPAGLIPELLSPSTALPGFLIPPLRGCTNFQVGIVVVPRDTFHPGIKVAVDFSDISYQGLYLRPTYMTLQPKTFIMVAVTSVSKVEISGLGTAINSMLDMVRNTETKRDLFANNIHQVFWVKDADTLRFSYISSAHQKLWGRRRISFVFREQAC